MSSVFNKKIVENIQERKFVGANLPLPTHSFLTMYALSVSTSKSSVVNTLVSMWVDKNEIKVEELEKDIAGKALQSFKESKTPLDKFTNILKMELSKKGVELPSVTNIIKIFTDEANK